ncbi:MAG TPA: hypothetical protein VIL36_02860, partial [Acidimicrobiales bacterium]
AEPVGEPAGTAIAEEPPPTALLPSLADTGPEAAPTREPAPDDEPASLFPEVPDLEPEPNRAAAAAPRPEDPDDEPAPVTFGPPAPTGARIVDPPPTTLFPEIPDAVVSPDAPTVEEETLPPGPAAPPPPPPPAPPPPAG